MTPSPPTTPPAAPFRLGAAEAFVLANGTTRQRAYWKAAFGWGPVETWLFEMEPFQGPAGGWGSGLEQASGLPFAAAAPGGPDTLRGTVAALRWLAWVNLGEDVFEVLPRTLAFLAERQGEDGRWCTPGEPWGAVWETAAIAAYLAFMNELPERVEAASRFVLQQVGATGPGIEAPLNGLLVALLRGRALPGAEALAVAAYAALAVQVEDGGLPTAELAWVHELLVQAGYGDGDPVREAIRAHLGGLQRPDGSFEPGAGEAVWDAVDTTFFASRALVSR